MTAHSGVRAGPPAPVAGLLLTGGASRRMGRDKALLEVDGQRLADRAAGLLAEVADPVLEVGPGHTRRPALPAVREDPEGAGPLAALAAGAAALSRLGYDGPVLLLAVDMPRVSARLLRLLAGRGGPGTAVPVVGGLPQPLCARYGAEALDAAPALLAAGERSLRGLLAAVEVGWVEPAEWEAVAGAEEFADLDTPGDLDRLRSEL